MEAIEDRPRLSLFDRVQPEDLEVEAFPLRHRVARVDDLQLPPARDPLLQPQRADLNPRGDGHANEHNPACLNGHLAYSKEGGFSDEEPSALGQQTSFLIDHLQRHLYRAWFGEEMRDPRLRSGDLIETVSIEIPFVPYAVANDRGLEGHPLAHRRIIVRYGKVDLSP